MENSKVCIIYLIRHGQTEWNLEHKIQGHLDSPLTKMGVKQAEHAAEKLKKVKFDTIFSSDLLRAKRTAEIININKKLEIITAKALRERTFGEHDGTMGEEYQNKIIHLLEEFHQMSEEDKWKFKFAKNYESDEELVTRFIVYLREIAIAHIGKTVLVVSHGGNIRTFLTRLGYAEYGKLTPGTFLNAGYVKVTSDGVDFFIEEVEGVDQKKGLKIKTL